jgi:uncharacterized protein (TIGR03067 family)
MLRRRVSSVLGMTFGLGVVLAVSVIAAAERPGGSGQEQAARAKFVGVWKGFVVDGKGENPDRGHVELEITVTERTMHGTQIRDDGNLDHGVGQYTLNLAAVPNHLDAAQTVGRGRQRTYVGIYKLDGDTLHWCVSPQKVRPETFETVKGQFLLILRRTAVGGVGASR